MTRIALWALGWMALALGIIGVFLPIMPTVPFLLVAVWAFGKVDKRVKNRILSHPVYGPDIRAWQDHGAIRPTAKAVACATMAGSIAFSAFFGMPRAVLMTQIVVLGAAAVYLLSRPSR